MGGKITTIGQLQGKKQGGHKASKQLHPKSRRAQQLIRIGLRDQRISHGKKERREIHKTKTERYLWFAHAMDPEEESMSVEDIHELIRLYLSRHDEEIAEEVRARRKGRPKSKRHEALETDRDGGKADYKLHGFVVPDLSSVECVKQLGLWTREDSGAQQGFLPRIRLIRLYSQDSAQHDQIVVVQEGIKESFAQRSVMPKSKKASRRDAGKPQEESTKRLLHMAEQRKAAQADASSVPLPAMDVDDAL
ncbi:uncharacterized protein L969DRAFT_16916 [Mixia osmundae IAM 14324]|uniref:Translation machinery-associated protein 16 n=1 Tax=Mixia osmundae (strain CBS 9802 / IAM 14324 / JCM 22182 / KY 12970) TaxID=764103 RepID=G7E8Z7_MIXOS|nr:uncharacterized protein L969DRAFT_16916 [Mixia osmundae IAM 14324]KEI40251.1 hypothetical protein L969DRAFT_16916 [Mixia osmundae IAM 14324]GAA99615.1 hypothetical protein E5Q_06316 [Mixia osmundae IAM 14324]